MQNQIKIAINGFGRIGRAAFKIALNHPNNLRMSANSPRIEVVAINDLTDTLTLAHLLRYDSVYGKYEKEVAFDNKNIIVDGKKIPVFAQKEPEKLPWKKFDVDIVLECTGRFVKDSLARAHLKAGAKKVILSAPAKGKGKVPTFIMGVNHEEYQGEDLISCASCTTNCVAPVTKVIAENFGIKKAYLTTIHAYTADQNLVDGPHKDLRRARAAGFNIVLTTTGAALATIETIPKLKDKFDGIAIRVPVICGSISDLVFQVRTKTTPAKVNQVFKKAARSKNLKGILEVSTEALVSSDIIKTSASAIVDLALTQVIQGDLVKVLAWYDNEWGYSCRLVELAELLGKSL